MSAKRPRPVVSQPSARKVLPGIPKVRRQGAKPVAGPVAAPRPTTDVGGALERRHRVVGRSVSASRCSRTKP